jgi:general secretion pathway protein G
VIGKRMAGGATPRAGWGKRARARLSLNPRSAFRHPHPKGFTLLELMIVISILVILALIAVAQYNKTVLAAREATLKSDLNTMRRMIDQYAADKGKLPQSLDDLVSAGYIDEIKPDPITDQKDWQVEFGDDPGSTDNAQGVVNVRSASNDISADGQSRYNEW